MQASACTTCGVRRLKPESLAVTLAGQNIGDLVQLSITDALTFFENVPVRGNGKPGLDPEIAAPILKEVRERLRFLNDVGLEYLTLAAGGVAPGGEAQKDSLATQIACARRRVCYPRRAVHPCTSDNARLLNTLRQLRDLGNTVVVEHDEETMQAADHLIDSAGGRKHGGLVIAEGLVAQVGPTRIHPGRYLRG